MGKVSCAGIAAGFIVLLLAVRVDLEKRNVQLAIPSTGSSEETTRLEAIEDGKAESAQLPPGFFEKGTFRVRIAAYSSCVLPEGVALTPRHAAEKPAAFGEATGFSRKPPESVRKGAGKRRLLPWKMA
jgi:hypothetical protein